MARWRASKSKLLSVTEVPAITNFSNLDWNAGAPLVETRLRIPLVVEKFETKIKSKHQIEGENPPVCNFLPPLPSHKQLKNSLLPPKTLHLCQKEKNRDGKEKLQLHLRVPDVGVAQVENLDAVESKSCC